MGGRQGGERTLPKMARTWLCPAAACIIVCVSLLQDAAAESFRVTEAPLDSSRFDGFALLGDDLYYGVRVEEQKRSKLIRVDGKTGDWEAVAEVPDQAAPLHIREVEVLDGAVYFVSAPLLKYFGTLWKYTPAERQLEPLKIFDSVAPREMAVVGGRLLLAVWATSRDRSGIWRTDGTAAGSTLLGTGFVPENLKSLEPYVYFTSLGTDLYRVGVNGGVLKIVGGINFRDTVNRRILQVARNDFRVYFLASERPGELLQLWSTDGSTRNTRQETFLLETPKKAGKQAPPVNGGGAAGVEPPYLGIIDGYLVFSVADYPFHYFYRHRPGRDLDTRAELVTETPVTFQLPFDGGVVLAGPLDVDRRQMLFVGKGTISDINATFGLGRVPGPLLSTRAAAYFVDIGAAQSGADPANLDFPLYRVRSATGIPTRIDTGEALAGKILGAAAAVTDTVAYAYLLDPSGQDPVRLTQIRFTDDGAEGEGEQEGITEGAVEGQLEGEAPDPEDIRVLAQQILDVFATTDANGDGVVTEQELSLAGIVSTPPLFRALDTSADGVLSREELKAAGAVPVAYGCGCGDTADDWTTLLSNFFTFALTAAVLLLGRRVTL